MPTKDCNRTSVGVQKTKKDGKVVWIVIRYVCNEIKVCKVFYFQWSNGTREKGYDERGGRKCVMWERKMWHFGFKDWDFGNGNDRVVWWRKIQRLVLLERVAERWRP